jgi:hypothetical protein
MLFPRCPIVMSAVDEAGRVAHSRHHPLIRHRPQAGGIASQPPIFKLVQLCVVGGERHVIVVKAGSVDLRELGEHRFPKCPVCSLDHMPAYAQSPLAHPSASDGAFFYCNGVCQIPGLSAALFLA